MKKPTAVHRGRSHRRIPEERVLPGEFHADRESFERLVMEADLANEDENALRRALLFRRRGHMWREVPSDTQWWEVELEPDDLELH